MREQPILYIKKKTGPLGIIPVSWVHLQTEKSQTARPGTTTCRPYKYVFRAWIEPTTRSAAVGRSTTVPAVS